MPRGKVTTDVHVPCRHCGDFEAFGPGHLVYPAVHEHIRREHPAVWEQTERLGRSFLAMVALLGRPRLPGRAA